MLNLISGLRINRKFYMYDFRHDGLRYRPITNFETTEENQPKAENILNKIRKDLSKNSFFLSNYEKHFKNPEKLALLDAELKKIAKIMPTNELILKVMDEYKTRVTVGTLGLATYENYVYAANLHTLPYFKKFRG